MLWEDNYLTHHGIIGQRWGVRRFQNKDGSLTAEGKERYYNDKSNKDKKTVIKEEKSASSHSEKEHYDETKKKIDTFIKIAAGVALATAVAYGTYKAYKHLDNFGDYSIGRGKILTRIQTESENVIGKQPFFASYKKGDVLAYKSTLAKERINKNGSCYLATGKVGRKLKIAGSKTAEEVYNDLAKNNIDFKSGIDELKKKPRSGIESIPLHAKTDYELFNVKHLCGKPNKTEQKLRDIFYESLKARGYDGVLDHNDRNGWYKTKKPTIIFNGSGIVDSKVSSFSIDEMNAAKKAFDRFEKREMVLNKVTRGLSKNAPKALIVEIGLVAAGVASKHNVNKMQEHKEEIDRYRKDHPNTTLSDYEIYNVVSKKK